MRRADWFEWLLYAIGWFAMAVVGLLGLSSLIAPRLACSAELSPLTAAHLYAEAYSSYGALHGGVPLPQVAPVVRLRSHARICADWGSEPGCIVQAYYDGREVVIAEELDFESPAHASFLLHEFIHYLQHQTEGPATDCGRWLAYEHEAYAIQARWLERLGQHDAARKAHFAARLQFCHDHSRQPGSLPKGREQRCMEALVDHLVIVDARMSGKSAEELSESALHPEPLRTEVLALIAEAYAQDDVRAWFVERYWVPCLTGGRE